MAKTKKTSPVTLAAVKAEFKRLYPKFEFEFGFHEEIGNVYRYFREDGEFITSRSTARTVARDIKFWIEDCAA